MEDYGLSMSSEELKQQDYLTQRQTSALERVLLECCATGGKAGDGWTKPAEIDQPKTRAVRGELAGLLMPTVDKGVIVQRARIGYSQLELLGCVFRDGWYAALWYVDHLGGVVPPQLEEDIHFK